jgi:hypothetical protein
MIQRSFLSFIFSFTLPLIALASEPFNPDELEGKLETVRAMPLPDPETFEKGLAAKYSPALKEDCENFMEHKRQIKEVFDLLLRCDICQKENPYRRYNLRVQTPEKLQEELDRIKKRPILSRTTKHMRDAVEKNRRTLEAANTWHMEHLSAATE